MTSSFTVVFSSLENPPLIFQQNLFTSTWIALHGRSAYPMAGHQMLEWVEWPLGMAIKALYRDHLLLWSVTWVMHLEVYYVNFPWQTMHCYHGRVLWYHIQWNLRVVMMPSLLPQPIVSPVQKKLASWMYIHTHILQDCFIGTGAICTFSIFVWW